MTSELPPSLNRFIRSCIPTYQAAEVLLFFAAHPERAFTPEDIVVSMRPVVVTLPAVQEYTGLFTSCGLIVEEAGAFNYCPASPDLEHAIGQLSHAYNERPVTLINVIYRMADGGIRSFADAFKLRKD